MRFLSFDLGDRRTGVAIADTVLRTAMPLAVLEVPIHERAGDSLLDAISRTLVAHIAPHDACTLVVGLPLNMDGTEGPRAKSVRVFAGRIATGTARDVVFQDERLTSAQADWDMARSGRTHAEKKALRDALAAATLLQDYINALPRE